MPHYGMPQTVKELLNEIESAVESARQANFTQTEWNKRMRECLVACRHALVAHNGLIAHDGDPDHTFELDEREIVKQIDAALSE